MGNIRDLLNKIRYATYGKEVRQSIHDAIEECYATASVDHDNANMEVKMARGTHNTLNERFTSVEENIKNNSEQLEETVNNTKKLQATLSKTIELAGIANNKSNWLHDNDNDFFYFFGNQKKGGYTHAILVLDVGITDDTHKAYVAYNQKLFSDWKSMFDRAFEACTHFGITVDAIKIHMTTGYDGFLNYNQIEYNLGGWENFMTEFKALLDEICTYFYAYNVKNAVLFNEMTWIYTNETYDNGKAKLADFIVECFNIVKSHNMKVSISLGTTEYLNVPEKVKEGFDFLSTNYYPDVCYNGLNVNKSAMIQRVMMAEQYKIGFMNMLRSGKDIWITETGCKDRYDGLAKGSAHDENNFIDKNNHDGLIQQKYLEIAFELFNDSQIKNVCIWFDTNWNITDFINKYTGR